MAASAWVCFARRPRAIRAIFRRDQSRDHSSRQEIEQRVGCFCDQITGRHDFLWRLIASTVLKSHKRIKAAIVQVKYSPDVSHFCVSEGVHGRIPMRGQARGSRRRVC